MRPSPRTVYLGECPVADHLKNVGSVYQRWQAQCSSSIHSPNQASAEDVIGGIIGPGLGQGTAAGYAVEGIARQHPGFWPSARNPGPKLGVHGITVYIRMLI
jgi:hypothetical protein